MDLVVVGGSDAHKAYYPSAHPITISVTGDARSGRLLGAQLVGRLGTDRTVMG